MVPTFVELKEPNIIAVWRKEETAVVSHGPVHEHIGGDEG